MRFFNFTTILFLITLILILPSSEASNYALENYSNIIIKDKNNIFTQDKLIVYENNIYYGVFNYSQPIPLRDNYNYHFIIDDDIIDYSNNQNFIFELFNNYGYIFLAFLIICFVIGIGIYIIRRVGKK